MSTELYKVHRPKIFKTVLGQPDAVAMLTSMLEQQRVPHSLLFVGPSGCGKTTLARIVKNKLECSDQDFSEVNAAEANGIDMVRDIKNRMSLAPIGGKVRIWLIDEAHQLTSQAQNALLKILEDTPKHVYFFLATTDPQKLLPTIRTRCTDIKVREMGRAPMLDMMKRILEKEGKTVTNDVMEKICEHSYGSARKSLVLLNQVLDLKTEEDQLTAIASSDVKAKAIELARALLQPKATWAEVARLLKGIEEDPESLRHMVLGYCSAIMLSGGPLTSKAFCVLTYFNDNFYDSKRAGLIAACYAVVTSK
jgi:DNA polymerase-3 subunit gamma/tau